MKSNSPDPEVIKNAYEEAKKSIDFTVTSYMSLKNTAQFSFALLLSGCISAFAYAMKTETNTELSYSLSGVGIYLMGLAACCLYKCLNHRPFNPPYIDNIDLTQTDSTWPQIMEKAIPELTSNYVQNREICAEISKNLNIIFKGSLATPFVFLIVWAGASAIIAYESHLTRIM